MDWTLYDGNTRAQRMTAILRVAFLAPLLLLAACADILRHPAPPDATPPAFEGFDKIRYYPLDHEDGREEWQDWTVRIADSYKDESPENYVIGADGVATYSYLAISGGGSDGAFGAGLLNGWTKSGTRPKFKIVTGVSTGSLIAPLAFLGPDYDDEIKQAYTTINADNVMVMHDLISILWSDSLSDNAPFRAMVAHYVTPKLLDAIAAEHAKGRLLFVLTTDLDREQPVIWDMGAIASSKDAMRVHLFREVLIASASIPTVFPPVMLKVQVNGQTRDEMHVDGGVFMQSFFVGSNADMKAMVRAAHPEWTKDSVHSLYIIRNSFVTPNARPVKRSLGDISSRSISGLLKVSGINDLYRMYLGVVGKEFEMRYVAIPAGYVPTTDEQFDRAEMIRLYGVGEKMGETGIPWRTLPPGYRPPADAPPAAK